MFLQKMEPRSRHLHVIRDTDLPDGEEVDKRWKKHLGFEGHDEGNVWRTAKAPGDATRIINGKEDLWNPPPSRESQLDVVKKGLVYDLRAYRGEKKKPSKLYENDDDDLRYQVPPEEASLEKAKKLEEERWEIIRNQAMKKRITVAERWSSIEHLEDSPVRNVTETGSDVCFNNSSSRRTSVDPPNVDMEQINFTTARQQFLELEKKNPKLLLRSNKPRNFSHGDELQGPPTWEDTSLSDAPHQGGLGGSHERTDLLVWSRKGPSTQVLPAQDSTGGNQPSGLEKPPWEVKTVTVYGRESSRRSGEPLDGLDLVEEEEEETPIEREIRMAQEREEDLWKERGIIPKANAREELVQIQTRPLLSASVSSRKGKEKRPVSFYFQREMEQETRREEALMKEGRLSATYSKAETQELAQRRRVFEQPVAETPLGKHRQTPNGDDSLAFWDPSLKNHDGGGTDNQERKWTSEEAHLTSSTPEFGQERLGSLPHKMSHLRVDLTPPSSPGLVLRKEHFAIPVGQLRFSFAGDRETARGRRNQLASGGLREEPYTLKPWKPQTSALIDQEIQEALEREEELKEQRRKVQGVQDSRMSSQSSVASGMAGSYSVSASPVFSPMSPPPWRAFPDRLPHEPDPKSCLSPSRRRREDGKYAGIELSDEIDTEVVQSTKPICRRGVLAQLWESGQIRHIDDDSGDDDQA